MIAAVVLAAGGSRRLGRPKQLVELAGKPLVRHVAEAALDGGCAPVIVVLGAEIEAVRRALDGLDVETVVNRAWKQGMSGSIRVGLTALRRRREHPGALLLLTGDQPRIDPAVVERIRGCFDGSERALVASEYAGTIGVPALFGRGWFGELATLEGDRGAKRLLLEHAGDVQRVPWPGGAVDVDRPADLEAF